VGDKGDKETRNEKFPCLLGLLVPLSPCPLVPLSPMIRAIVGQCFSGTIFRRQVYVLRSL
jgi:hypothetical protein